MGEDKLGIQAISSQDGSLVYDPDQDQDERREIRKNYRTLQEDESLLNAKTIGIDDLTQKVHEADRLFVRVRGPQEATLDSAFLVTASSLGAAKARQMRSDTGGFDIDDFVAKLVTYMGGRWQGSGAVERGGSGARTARGDRGGRSAVDNEDADYDEDVEFDEAEAERPLNWDLIGRRALAKSRRVPVMDFMIGPLSIEQKRRNIIRKTRFERNVEVEKRPQELKEDDIEKSENETTKNVAAVEKLLAEQEGAINLFRFIVNPGSFGQSVENLFYLSFLIRDGKVALEISEDTGEPVVWLCEPPTDDDYAQGVRKKQMVMELDMGTWERAINVFSIKEPMIPSREPSRTKLGKKWYG